MILDDLVATTRQHMVARQAQVSLADLQAQIAAQPVRRSFDVA